MKTRRDSQAFARRLYFRKWGMPDDVSHLQKIWPREFYSLSNMKTAVRT